MSTKFSAAPRLGRPFLRGFGVLFGLIFGALSGLVALCLSACALLPGEVDSIVTAPDGRGKIVQTGDGPVVGTDSPRGEAFLGLPYAAPPLGELRWRAPQPPTPWSKPRPAFRLGDGCLQNLSLDAQLGRRGAGPIIGSEDCLTLNVYAPAGTATGDRRPVMVWIYGGAFMLGSSGQYDPSVLAQRSGAIVVSFNYRLGALGFLAHPGLHGEAGEGAFALLDQQAALRWVRDNIAAFGGDPTTVTLFGQSAGGWSVCEQLVAPGAVGLFARAIVQSGSCTAPQAVVSLAAAETGGRLFAEDLGCGGVADSMACLKQKSARDVVRALPERDGVLGPNSWSPAFGGPVLPLPPRRAFETGRFAAVPVIDGATRDEGRLFSFIRGLRGELRSPADYAAGIEHMYGAASARILAEYPAERFESPGLAYAAVLTDSYFACSARTLERLLAGKTRVYAYEFDDPDAVSRLPRLPWTEAAKSFHTAEIAYVFQTPWALADPADFSPAQRRLSEAMQAYWGNFAGRGDPNGADLPPWPAFGGSNGAVLRLAPDAIGPIDATADPHRCAFWTSLGY